MGEEEKRGAVLMIYDGEKWHKRAKDFYNAQTITHTLNGAIGELPKLSDLIPALTITAKLKVPRTRRKFIKYLMSNGKSRNEAKAISAYYHALGASYREAFIMFLLEAIT